ncbi:MAG: GtrA family protein, partial [Bacteroides sp.]
LHSFINHYGRTMRRQSSIKKRKEYRFTMNLFKKIFIEPTNYVLLQLIRYTFVGGIAFIVDFTLLFLLTEYANFHYLLSASISFISGLVVNYMISIRWVFIHSKIANKKIEFISYATIGLIGLCFTELLMWTFTDSIGFNYMFSKLITTILVYLWNFSVRKYLLF